MAARGWRGVLFAVCLAVAASERSHETAMEGVDAGLAGVGVGSRLLSRLEKEGGAPQVGEGGWGASSHELLKELKVEARARISHLSREELEEDESTASRVVVGGVAGGGRGEQHGQQLEEVKKQWAYDGAHGPATWGDAFPACGRGTQQSPIAVAAAEAREIGALSHIALIDWSAPPPLHAKLPSGGGAPKIFLDLPLNSRFKGARALLAAAPEELFGGHAFTVEGLGGPALFIDGTSYVLTRIYTRTPSEHMLDGRKYALEVQLVHAPRGSGTHAHTHVGVSVLFDDALQGASPGFVHKFAEAAHGASSEPRRLVDGLKFEDIADAVRGSLKEYFRYPGSLTMPPCTEGTTWFLARRPLPVSADDVEKLAGLEGANNRPLQPLNGRTVQKVTG